MSVEVELLAPLDEKYLASAIAYEAMHAAAALVLDGTSWRRSDGSLDRAAVTEQVTWLAETTPELRKRIVRTPLGLTTPAWVPDAHFAIERHLRFVDTPVELGPGSSRALTGRDDPLLPHDRPPWEIVVVEAVDGRVVLIVRFQHVMGDALWAMSVLDRLLTVGPSGERPEPVTIARRPPRGVGELLVVAARQWYRTHGSPAAAWRDYWSRPFRRRIRRTGGRLLRPMRDRMIDRRGLREHFLPARHSASVSIDLAVVTGHAKRYPCTVSDLVLASVLTAIAERDGAGAALLVPMSSRTRKDPPGGRNRVGVVRVSVPAESDLAGAVPDVRAQIRAAILTGAAGLPPVTEPVSGYATYIPLAGRDRYIGSARLDEILAWPAGEPSHDIACFATSYSGRLVLTMTTRTTTDVSGLLNRVAALIEDGTA